MPRLYEWRRTNQQQAGTACGGNKDENSPPGTYVRIKDLTPKELQFFFSRHEFGIRFQSLQIGSLDWQRELVKFCVQFFQLELNELLTLNRMFLFVHIGLCLWNFHLDCASLYWNGICSVPQRVL